MIQLNKREIFELHELQKKRVKIEFTNGSIAIGKIMKISDPSFLYIQCDEDVSKLNTCPLYEEYSRLHPNVLQLNVSTDSSCVSEDGVALDSHSNKTFKIYSNSERRRENYNLSQRSW